MEFLLDFFEGKDRERCGMRNCRNAYRRGCVCVCDKVKHFHRRMQQKSIDTLAEFLELDKRKKTVEFEDAIIV